ncbi:hypothetical protein [Burkholderia sp. SIMBA_062]|uniref:CIS tube protein n=1 Tax=Burkholderia sp. SIMBA_062 TaxID=3085803 RepID=UPI00397DB6E2
MALLERGLEKLTLTAFKTRDWGGELGSFVVMYNPESVRFDFMTQLRNEDSINRHNQVSEFGRVTPPHLDLELILDARGPGERRSVDEQISQLRALCLTVGEKGETPYLRVSWGKMRWHGHGYFGGRCERLGIAYTLFDRNATPLRATASLSLVAINSDDMEALRKGAPVKQSIIKASARDTLPLLATVASASAAVSAVDYLHVAYANDLDNLRNLIPGQALVMGR